MKTLKKAKDSILSGKDQEFSVGPKNFKRLYDWHKSADYLSFLSLNGLVDVCSFSKSGNEMRFHRGSLTTIIKLKQ